MYILYICILAPFIQIGFSLIGEDTDLNSLSSYEAVDDSNDSFEIWNSETDAGTVVQFDSFSKAQIEEICKHSNTLVYITQEDVTIDCGAYNSGNKPIDAAKSIHKRSAESEIEGSGAEVNHYESDTTQEPASSVGSLEDQDGESNTIQQSTTGQVSQTEDINSEASEEPTTVHIHEELPEKPEDAPVHIHEELPEKPEDAPTEEHAPETKSDSEIQAITPEIPTTQTESDHRENDNQINGEVSPDAAKTDQPTPPEEVKTESNVTDQPNIKVNEPNLEQVKQEHALPTNEVLKEAEDETDKGDKSDSDVRKKGRGMIAGSPNQDSDKQHTGNNGGDEPGKPDESTEDTTKKAGSKDTTILVVLFVAVVVVGALAFGYNFIKKRRQQSTDLERVERASLKRSLQNLAKPDNEPEKKPLMGDGKEVEMVDMKKSTSSLEETSERTPNESVKT